VTGILHTGCEEVLIGKGQRKEKRGDPARQVRLGIKKKD
jgi:hypothetical protein